MMTLITAGIAVTGWLLGAAGQAHADTTSGARLLSTATYTGRSVSSIPAIPRVTTIPRIPRTTGHLLLVRHVAPAVRTSEAALRPSRPPAILALPPATTLVRTGVPRPRASVDTGGPSRTQRHAGHDARKVIGGGPLTHTGPLAVMGASEKASTEHAARSTVPAPVSPRLPRPLPRRIQTLPPTASGGIDQPGLCRTVRPGAACRRVLVTALRTGVVPPAVRTAADEPSFSPD
jgi:hypothetical protein